MIGRKVLLLEPNYKNKYPPMGLMKLATYYRDYCHDDVRFYKGNLKELAALLLCEEFLADNSNKMLRKHTAKFVEYIKTKKSASIRSIDNDFDLNKLNLYHIRFKNKAYPKFDIVCVTTLFTFYWKETIDTINFAKEFCKDIKNVYVGGIAASLVPKHIINETGIRPHIGLLDSPGALDKDSDVIIDHLPLDYSILEEIDYHYPAEDAYYAYMTRGCVNRCKFCAVPELEPKYCGYISLKRQIEQTESRFGAKNDLLLLDNNVFASRDFNKIINEIIRCGFGKKATYAPPSEYEIAFRNLRYNPRGYIRKIVSLYDAISERLADKGKGAFYSERENHGLLFYETATIKAITAFDETARPLYDKHFKRLERVRYIDFNQGVDARQVTEEKMRKLAEINVRPLRIAFDDFSKRDIYEKAVRLAAKYGIKHLSNYLLYNYEDKPIELYERLKLNVELCEELDVKIYSFPMKYHPITDPVYFRTRDYLGIHWNRKFIRAVQAVLNSTKGKIGRGREFFEDAFGRNVEEFEKILWMPETFIIYRQKYDAEYRETLRRRCKENGKEYRICASRNDETNKWWALFKKLSQRQRAIAEDFIMQNRFFQETVYPKDKKVLEILEYYKIKKE